MANPHRGEVDLIAGEDSYKLCFSINAMCELEQLLDKSFPEIVRDMARLSVMRAVLWAGLLTNHKVTIEQAGDILQAAGGQTVTTKIKEAITLAFPPDDRKGTGQNPR